MSGTIKKISISIAVLISLLLVAALTLNLGFAKGFIETRASQSSGMEVRIAGSLSLRLGREVRLSASDITITNPKFPEQEPLAQLQQLDLNTPLSQLLSDTVRISQLRIDGLKLALEQDESLHGNWVSLGNESTGESAPVLIDDLEITRFEGGFISPRLDGPVAWSFETLTQQLDDQSLLTTRMVGSINAQAVDIEMVGGPWRSLLYGGKADLSLAVAVGDASIEGSASFVDIHNPTLPTLSLHVSGPSFAALTSMFSVDGLADGPMDLNIRLAPAEQQLEWGAQGALGPLQIEAAGQMDSLLNVTEASVDAHVQGDNFGRLAALAGFPGWPNSGFITHAELSTSTDGVNIKKLETHVADSVLRVQGTIPQFPALENAALELDVGGPDLAPFSTLLGVDAAPFGAFGVKGMVHHEDGQTQADLLFDTAIAMGAINGKIGEGEHLLGSEFELVANGDSLASLGMILDTPGLAETAWSMGATVSIPNEFAYEIADFQFENEGVQFDAHGTLGQHSIADNTEITMSMTGPDLSRFAALAGDTFVLPQQAFSLEGRVIGNDEAWALEDMTLLSGSERVVINGMPEGDQGLDIKASGTGLARYFAETASLRLPNEDFELETRVSLPENRLRISGLKATAGPFSAAGNIDIPWPFSIDDGHAQLEFSGHDVRNFITHIGDLELDKQPFDGVLDARWVNNKLNIDSGTLKVGDLLLSASGVLDLPPNLSATDFEVIASSPDLSTLGRIGELRWDTAPIDVHGTFTGTQTRFSMKSFEGTVGANALNGEFSIDFEPPTPYFTFAFHSERLDLSPFQLEPPQEVDSPELPADARLIPDQAFPMALLKRANGEFSWRVDELVLDDMTLRGNQIHGSVQDGALNVEEIGTDGHKGRLIASLSLSPDEQAGALLQGSVSATDLVFNLARQSAEQKNALPAFNMDISLSGRGNDARQAASTLAGHIRINSPGGQVPNISSDSASALFLAEVIAAISPSASKKDVIEIACFAADIPVAQGLMTMDPGIALQSDKLNIFVGGKVNLSDEKLDVNFRSETRKAISLSAGELVSPYVKLSGTLAKPSVALDAKGTLLSGGAAYLSGGLSILAKKALDSIAGSKNPCAKFLAEPENADQQEPATPQGLPEG